MNTTTTTTTKGKTMTMTPGTPGFQPTTAHADLFLMSIPTGRGGLYYNARLREDRTKGPIFRSRDDDGLVRYSYSKGKTAIGLMKVLAEIGDANIDTAITDVAGQEIRDPYDQRLAQFNRSHDMAEFVGAIAAHAENAAALRRGHHEHRIARRHGTRPQSLAHLHALHPTPHRMIECLATAVIRRWLPSVLSIIACLPPGERETAALEADQRGNELVRQLGRLGTLASKASDEHARWADYGFGAVDMAINLAVQLVSWANNLGGRMEDDGTPDTAHMGLLRSRLGDALADAGKVLHKLADERFDVLGMTAWVWDKPGMVTHARENGGIARELEALYHAKGSKFQVY